VTTVSPTFNRPLDVFLARPEKFKALRMTSLVTSLSEQDLTAVSKLQRDMLEPAKEQQVASAMGTATLWAGPITRLTLSEPVTFTTGTHYLALRNRNGSVSGPWPVTAGRTAYEVVVAGLLDIIERNLLRGDLRPGCPFVAIAFAADDDEGKLRAASDSVFTRIRAALCDCLMRADVNRADAEAFAALAVSASEGAIILSRARRDTEPFDATRRALLDQVDRLTGGKRP
jgi:hypothetical protein